MIWTGGSASRAFKSKRRLGAMQKRWFKTKSKAPSAHLTNYQKQPPAPLSSLSPPPPSIPLLSATQQPASQKREGLSSGLDLSPLGQKGKKQKTRAAARPQLLDFEPEPGNILVYYNDTMRVDMLGNVLPNQEEPKGCTKKLSYIETEESFIETEESFVETEESYSIDDEYCPADEVDLEQLAELEDHIALLSADRCRPEFDAVLDSINLPSLVSLSTESFSIVVHAAAFRAK
jgi:hypothetical protein